MQVNHGLLNVTVSPLRSSDVHWPFLVYVAYRVFEKKINSLAKNENVRYDDSNETLSNVFSVSWEITLKISITLFLAMIFSKKSVFI